MPILGIGRCILARSAKLDANENGRVRLYDNPKISGTLLRLITFMRDSFREPGVGGSSDTFNILDRGAGIRHCVVTTSTDAHETYMA